MLYKNIVSPKLVLNDFCDKKIESKVVFLMNYNLLNIIKNKVQFVVYKIIIVNKFIPSFLLILFSDTMIKELIKRFESVLIKYFYE